jgi:hypothetical protein
MGLRGYVHHGARFWPAAASFMLVALRPDDMTSANATLICPSCVRNVAKTALFVMDEQARGSYPIHAPGGAVEVCGPAPVYDLFGVSELPFCAGCAECREHIACNSGCSDCRVPDCPCRCRTLGHTPTEALVCRVCGTDLRSSDSEAIKKEVEAAEREGLIITDGCARAIAAQWFGDSCDGMVTHGYAFVSTGTIPAGLRNAWELLAITDWSEADRDHPDHPQLAALDRYLKHHGPREPVPGWADVWVRR